MESTSECIVTTIREQELMVLNSPEWGRLEKQIFGPGDRYRWNSTWTFSIDW